MPSRRSQKFFGPESRAEVAIVGELATEGGRYAVSGRIDRLAHDGAGWHLVDFKTDRAVPATPAEADPAYILQLALYRRLLMEMEPGAPVSATLVFTAGKDGPNVMPIPPGTDGTGVGRARNPRQSGSLTGPGRLPTF